MRLSLSFAAVALLGVAAFASPALAIEQIHIPDSSAADSSGPPDALFDKSIPTTWQKKSDDQQSPDSLSRFHFTVSGGDGYEPPASGFGEDARTPGSEFHTNGGLYSNPYYPQ